MSENINENVSVNKERENHREYNKTMEKRTADHRHQVIICRNRCGNRIISVMISRSRIADIKRQRDFMC